MSRLGREHDASRARFLRGDFRGRRAPLRPPWSLPEAAFVDACNRCGECAKRCPEGILVAGEGGFPKIEFFRGECTFCGDCLKACETGALRAAQGELLHDGTTNETPPWDLRAAVSREICIAFHGIVCRACGENCDAGAIHFRLAVGGFALPELDKEACSGCGACVRPCPVQAVKITRAANIRTEKEA
ncbi:MAG: ferredoxin-type protein NapF [Pseudomonadota bacterium]|nr:ferredoxin-type protein NapF [Pseudomonadota bacterium]